MSTLATDTTAAKITGVTYTPPGGSPQDHIDLQVNTYSITLDKARSPYVEGTLRVTTPEVGALALMDPTSLTLRCYVTLTRTGVSPALSMKTRNFDLVLRSVKNDAATGETILGLSSDECLLVIDMYAASSVDTTYQAYQASLRSIITAALATYGFTLNGTPFVDADYTITSNATNLILNPTGGAGSVAGWTTDAAGNGSLTTATATITGIQNQSKVIQSTMAASSTGGFVLNGGAGGGAGTTITVAGLPQITAGQTYTFGIWVKPSVTKTITLTAQPYNESTATVGSAVVNTGVSCPSGSWTLLTVTVTAPVGATRLSVKGTTTAWTAGQTLQYGGAILALGSSALTYFDGASTDTYYTYAWTGTANASTATRTRLDSRDPKVLDRIPGSAMWDWLNGLVQTPGYRLFCDEARVWRLVDNSYTVSGLISLTQAINLTQGTDTIDIGQADTDGQGWVQKVQVTYQWIDRVTTANITAYDFAGSGHGPGIKIVINTPYPGPGYAAAVLARMQGREHVLDLKALSDLNATPGMAVVASLPSLNETGLIASVTWTDEDEMTVGSEGLTTIPANAWSLAVGAWSAATGTWAGATGTN